ncbi:hypothetical protein HDV02_005709 [Globomyces sp. JEL0801]|nr:hypothetical protein HDV02_005709 [Globomyces sp. JEL0801]
MSDSGYSSSTSSNQSQSSFKSIKPMKTVVGFAAAFDDNTNDTKSRYPVFPRHAFNDSRQNITLSKHTLQSSDIVFQLPTAEQKRLIQNNINAENQRKETATSLPQTLLPVAPFQLINPPMKESVATNKSSPLSNASTCNTTRSLSPNWTHLTREIKQGDAIAEQFLSLFGHSARFSDHTF